jgi:flagellar hook-basal body complex protein FliE
MDASQWLEGLKGGAGLAALARPTPDGVIGEATPGGEGFGELVGRTLANTNQAQVAAESQVRELAAGRGDVVETMLSLSEADIALRMTLQLRNRALEAYQEILRVQV